MDLEIRHVEEPLRSRLEARIRASVLRERQRMGLPVPPSALGPRELAAANGRCDHHPRCFYVDSNGVLVCRACGGSR